MERLAELTRAPSNYVRGEAITALQAIGDARAVPAFMAVLATDTNCVRRLQAAEGLVGFAELAAAAAEPLRTALHDPQPRVRAAAAKALGQLGDTAAAPILKRMADVEEDRAARAAFEEALLAVAGRES